MDKRRGTGEDTTVMNPIKENPVVKLELTEAEADIIKNALVFAAFTLKGENVDQADAAYDMAIKVRAAIIESRS